MVLLLWLGGSCRADKYGWMVCVCSSDIIGGVVSKLNLLIRLRFEGDVDNGYFVCTPHVGEI